MTNINLDTISKGLVPDPYDYHDIPLGAVQPELAAIPDNFVTDITQFKVNYQGRQPSCVAQTGSKIKEQQESVDGEKKIYQFSPRFLYALSKKTDGYNGDGTYLRNVMKVLAEYGVCFEAIHPDLYALSKEEYKDWTKIPESAYEIAKSFKIKSYARANTNFESLKQAIYQNGVVMMGFTGTNIGWRTGLVKPPQPDEPVSSYWGHGVMLYGYDKDYLYFRNSWGTNWGFNGNGKVGKDYAAYFQDAWVAVDIPNEIIEQYKQMKIIGDKQTQKQYAMLPSGKLAHIAGVNTLVTGDTEKIWTASAVEWVDDISKYEIVAESIIIAKV